MLLAVGTRPGRAATYGEKSVHADRLMWIAHEFVLPLAEPRVDRDGVCLPLGGEIGAHGGGAEFRTFRLRLETHVVHRRRGLYEP